MNSVAKDTFLFVFFHPATTYDTQTQFLYMYSIIMARYWEQMKALITTTVCRTETQ